MLQHWVDTWNHLHISIMLTTYIVMSFWQRRASHTSRDWIKIIKWSCTLHLPGHEKETWTGKFCTWILLFTSHLMCKIFFVAGESKNMTCLFQYMYILLLKQRECKQVFCTKVELFYNRKKKALFKYQLIELFLKRTN